MRTEQGIYRGIGAATEAKQDTANGYLAPYSAPTVTALTLTTGSTAYKCPASD